LVKSSKEARTKAKAMANEEAFTSGALSHILSSLYPPLHAYPLKTLLKKKKKAIVGLRYAVRNKNIKKIRQMAAEFFRIVSALHDKQCSV